MKTQLVADKHTRQIICIASGKGRRHDFWLYKASELRIHQDAQAVTDTGFPGVAKLHKNSLLPRKRSKCKPLTSDDIAFNSSVSSLRATTEHVIGFVRRFKIISDRYRYRRKRFALRFNLLAGICNFDSLL
jgi:hypothetical protein